MSTNKDIAARRAQLSPSKQAMLKKLTHKPVQESPKILHYEHQHIPLSFGQQRLWFLEQAAPESNAYHIPLAMKFRGTLQVDILERCIAEIVHRHTVLRTRIVQKEQFPEQHILPEMGIDLPVVDVSTLTQKEQAATIERLWQEEINHNFNLAGGSLWRAKLWRLGAKEHVFLFNVHHIIFDGWSESILNHEITTLYQAYTRRQTSPLPALSIQYSDYARWQREQYEAGKMAGHLAYWRTQLANMPVLELPTDFSRPSVANFQGSVVFFELSQQLSLDLQKLSLAESTTLFMTLLTAFQILLAHYSGQEDIAVGTLIANRSQPELEPLLGFFINTLVLRTQVDGQLSFRSLLHDVRETTLNAYSHQDLPFEKLVENLQPERDPSRNPLFQVAMALQNTPQQAMQLQGLEVEWIMMERGTSKFDLTLFFIQDESGQIKGAIEYNTSLFHRERIQRLAGHIERVLTAIAHNPEVKPGEINLLTPEEETLLNIWQQTDVVYESNCSLLQEIREQADLHPDTIAVVSAEEQLTYYELMRRAQNLAKHLCDLGVGEESLVGISIERSIELLTGLLGILFAGGAYVPLDPGYPEKRLQWMAEDANINWLLSKQGQSCSWLAGSALAKSAKEISIGQDEVCGQQPLCTEWHEDRLAYVIYTSGSTGRPKGAMLAHRGLYNRLHWMQETLQLRPEDRILQKTSSSFDVSVWEFFWPLLAGAVIVMAEPEGHKDVDYLHNTIAEQGITLLHFVPSLLQVFLRDDVKDTCQSLRCVICSGETLAKEHVERFFTLLDARLLNLYGATEATVDSTYWFCQAFEQGNSVPIGKAISNTQIAITDRYGQIAPIGVPGEALICGVGVARGYWERADITAERFIPDPWKAGERCYRTGDLARYREDGAIEFLGRKDYQVKLRGYRIELGEIEALIQHFPGVEHVAVLLRKDRPGEQRLIAYVTAHLAKNEGDSTTQLQSWSQIFDDAYKNTEVEQEVAFQIQSWNSSYTNEPLSNEEMREWVEQTTERILAFHPRHILEIGCGTGLLLLRLLPSCLSYDGTDFSSEALAAVRQQLLTLGYEENVSLWYQRADECNFFYGHAFDCVILNSVLQYFPDHQYLTNVLAKIVAILGDQGTIFLGDIRSLPLLSILHASIELSKAPVSMTGTRLAQLVQYRVEQEDELVIAPAFFFRLCEQFPQISHVDVLLKRGKILNEMIKFRYDVVIHLQERPALIPEIAWIDYQHFPLSLDALRSLLISGEKQVFGIESLPNQRLSYDQAILDNCQQEITVENIRERCSRISTGVDPEALWVLGEECGYRVEIGYREHSSAETYDILFVRQDMDPSITLGLYASQSFGESREGTRKTLINNPLQEQMKQKLLVSLRTYLQECLPGYMVPAQLLWLETMPLNPSGKIDRNHLPVPTFLPEHDEYSQTPGTDIERLLVKIWEEFLGIHGIGIKSNFFEIGGDSIRSILVVAKARELGLQITPRQIFQYQTIADLAPTITSYIPPEHQNDQPQKPMLPRHQLEQLQESYGEIEDIYGLSPLQQHMLARLLLVPEPSLYLVQRELHLHNLNIEAYCLAWQTVVNRHAILRSSIQWEGLDQPVRLIHAHADLVYKEEDWCDLSVEEQERLFQEYKQRTYQERYDVTFPSHMHHFVARVDTNSYWIAWNFSYMTVDGWTFIIVVSEFFRLYEAFCQEKELQLASPPSYKNYISWVHAQDLQSAKTFWLSQLQNWHRPPSLMAILPGNQPDHEGLTTEFLTVPASIAQATQQYIRQQHLTISTLTHSVWAIMLSVYSNSNDVTFGTVVTGRQGAFAGVEAVVGPAVNVLVSRIQIAEDDFVLPWLQRLQDLQANQSEYDYTPIQKLKDWLGIAQERTMFDSYLSMQNFGGLEERLKQSEQAPDNAQIESDDVNLFFAKMEYPLRFDIFLGERIELFVTYRQECFHQTVIQRLLQQMQMLLNAIVVDSLSTISDLKSIMKEDM